MYVKSLKTACKLLTLTIGLSFLFSCAQENLKEDISVTPVDVNESFEIIANSDNSETKPKDSAKLNSEDLKIIKSANARYKVKNVKIATYKIKEIAKGLNAYISDMRFENDSYRKENRFTIKIPQIYFDTMMDSVNKLVEFVDYENVSSEDVTEKYVDLQTRLKTKLEVKERYETILRASAKTVEDILAAEDRIRIIQEEIEAAQGKLKYLTNKVAYSTIQIDLYETVAYIEEPIAYHKTFWSKSKNGFSFGLDLIESVFVGLIYLWPLVILGIIIFMFVRKRRENKKAN